MKRPVRFEMHRSTHTHSLASFIAVACCLVLGPACKKAPSRATITKTLDGIRPGEERALAQGIYLKLFRIQATAPIGDGWQLATSTEGGFSVEMPLAFNDFRERATATDGVEVRTYSVGAKSPGGVAWAATCIARRDGKLGPDGGAPRPERTETRAKSISRIIEWSDRRCVLTIEAQGAQPLPSEADRARFLRSLKRTGPVVWR